MAAPLPEANASQPLNDLSPNQTRSQPLLNSIIYEVKKSIYKYNDVEIARWSGVLTKRQRQALNLRVSKKRGPMVVRGLYSSKLKAVPHPYQKLVPLNALLPVALRYPLNICSLSSITEGINFKSIKKLLTEVKSSQTLGANCSIAISVL